MILNFKAQYCTKGKIFVYIDVKLLLILKFANHQTKEPFVSSANKALVGTLILVTMGDVINIFAIMVVNKIT